MPFMIKCKSVYDKPHSNDGERIFVDRLWPEGISTRAAALAKWMLEIAPSYELWRHVSSLEKWDDYRKRYLEELASQEKKVLLDELRRKASGATVTLLFGTSDPQRNNAEILKELLACN